MSWLVDPVRRVRDRRLAFVGLALLVAVTSFLVVAGPRAFARISQQGVDEALAAIPPVDRGVALARIDRNTATQGPSVGDLAALHEEGAGFLASFPPGIAGVLATPTTVVETPSYNVVEGTTLATELRLRVMDGVADHVRILAGRAPTAATGSVPDPLRTANPGEPVAMVPQLEAEMSRAAADKLGLAVGASLTLVPETRLDPLAGGGPIGVKIVGIFGPTAASDPYWIDDARVTGFTLRELSSNATLVQSTVLLAADSYATLVTGIGMQGGTSGGITVSPPSRRVTWRYVTMATKLHPEGIQAVVDGLRRLEAVYPVNTLDPDAMSIQTGLLRRLVGLQGPWNAAAAVLSLAATGAATVALVCLWLVIAMSGEARRRVLLLQRERGASLIQALLSILVEAALGAIPAVVLGAFLAMRLVPGGEDRWALEAAVAVAGTTIVFEVLAVLRAVVGLPRLPGRPALVGQGVRARRLVFEGVIVVLAIAGAEALRRHGLQAGGQAAATGASGVIAPTSTAGPGAVDPLLVVVPVLVGVAAGIVAIRLARFPLAGVAWLSSWGRGLGWVLAARRAARAAWASRALLVILPIASLGAFASATLIHVQRTAELESWQGVGAPYRVDAGTDPLAGGFVLPADLDPANLPGVMGAVRAYRAPVGLSGGARRELIAMDLDAYGRLLAGSPVALALPAEILAPPTAPAEGSPLPGSVDRPLPAIVSAGDVGSHRGFALGDVFQATIDTQPISFRVVGLRERLPAVPAGQPFVLISWPQLDAAAPGRLPYATNLFLTAGPGAGPAIAAAVHGAVTGAVVSAQSSRAAAIDGQSVVGVLSAGILALAAIAVLYAALAVVAAFILTAAARADEAAHLTTLGLSAGQSRWMLLVEFGPPVVLGALAGTGLGLGLFAYLAPGLGFETLLGVLQTAPPGVEPLQVGLLIALLGAMLLLGVALGAPAQRRAAWASVRRGLR